ncbi:hypothetical protein HYW76_03980 [Candidatus Pacearchaeota archaeon]|nr:hypothetical protein [Candidatus Pacearchaeota archaeon]
MWFQKKKVIDFTKTKHLPIPKSSSLANPDYKDLTPQSSNANSSPLSFFSNIASSAEDSSSMPSQSGDIELKHLKVKIEDAEYKLESVYKKLNNILDRLDVAEKKIDRNDRRDSAV